MPDENELIELEKNTDDPATKLEGEVKEKEVENLDVKIDDIPNSSGEKEEDGADVVKKLMEDVGAKEKDSKEAEKEGADIPDAFTKACLAEGWTEDEIKEFANDLDDADLLAELITEEKEKEEPAKQETKEEKSKSAEKSGDESTNKELAELKKELAGIKAAMGEATKEKATKDEEAIVQTVNQAFDEANKSFEIFGKTEELLKYPAGPEKGQVYPMSPAMKARQSVWDKAAPFVKGGMPVNEAMEIGLTWFKGANLEKDVERKYIKDLKKHERKLSAKRSGKETVKTYEDEDERKADVVREAARNAGVKGEYGL